MDNPHDFKYLPFLNEKCADVCAEYIHPKLKKILSVRAHFYSRPASNDFFYSTKLQKWVDNIIYSVRPAVVFCFSSTMAEYVFRSGISLPLVKKTTQLIMDFCDVDSKKWLDYAKIQPWPLSLFFKNEGKLLARYEEKIARNFQTCFLASTRERDLFHSSCQAENVHVLENGVDLDFFKENSVESECYEKNFVVVFTGAMDYAVNIDGVMWFVDCIWPEIKMKCPAAKFYIVGSNPAPKIRALDCRDDIVVTGYVDDIRKYYEMATVCVAPLRVARGIQNKVLEAMAMSRPVVATSNAFEGIEAIPGLELCVVDEPKQFADSVISLLNNPPLRKQIGNRARTCMERNYKWEVNLAVLDNFIPDE